MLVYYTSGGNDVILFTTIKFNTAKLLVGKPILIAAV